MLDEIGAERLVPAMAVTALPRGKSGQMQSARNRRAGSAAFAENPETGAGCVVPAMAGHAVPPGGHVQAKYASNGQSGCDLTATLLALREYQAQRKFCIKSQSRCNRSIEAYIARGLGFSTDLEDKKRKALFAEASRIRREVEKSGGGQEGLASNGQRGCAPAVTDFANSLLILQSAQARIGWDEHRTKIERYMRTAVRTLPIWQWADGVRGLGELGVAIILGEAGNPSNYATIEKLWKRLGLAVIDGERQQRKSNAEQAAAHGYNPSRRAEIWTVADSLFRAQWRGAKDDAPAHALGPYGEAYARRKQSTDGREWSAARRDADARRVMTKALLRDMWRAWRAMEAVDEIANAIMELAQ